MRIVGVGTSNPKGVYSQEDILRGFKIDDDRIHSVFLNSHIDQRHLCLPAFEGDDPSLAESQGRLLDRHRVEGVDLGSLAIERCLERAGHTRAEVRYLCCVSSTGFLVPGLSALIVDGMGLRRDCGRLDVLGMGCNAGLNGMNAVGAWARANPGALAVMVCVEVCSASYVLDGTMRTAVVNSLFGDGAAACAIVSGTERLDGPRIVKFASLLIPDSLDAMRFDWDERHHKFNFFLDRDVPYIVGAHVERAVESLLDGTGLRRKDIAHWVVHSGGKKVIDSIRVNLGLTAHDLRHTSGVLRDFGNLSSGSFLFSYQRLIGERAFRPGEHCVLMTMGPGSTIEVALLRW